MARTRYATDASVAAASAATQLAAPAGGTGAAAGGWDTAPNRDLGIASINAARDDIIAIKAELALIRTKLGF